MVLRRRRMVRRSRHMVRRLPVRGPAKTIRHFSTAAKSFIALVYSKGLSVSYFRTGEMLMAKNLLLLLAVFLGAFWASVTSAQQYPIMDKIAGKVIQKYQQSSCQQLRAQRGQPPSSQEQRAMQLLHDDPQLREAFINKVAAPIANKMFECGMIP
jgi:hypothetical protein